MDPHIEIQTLYDDGEDQEKKAQGERGRAAQNLYERASEAYSKAAGLADQHLGRFDEITLTLRDRLASTLRQCKKFSRAISINKENVVRYQDCQGDQGLLTLEAKRRLAECYVANRDYADAVKTYRNILESNSQSPLIESYHDRTDLATALFALGTNASIMEAVNCNIKTLDMITRRWGQSHIEAINVRHNLGTELAKLGKHEDALKNFEKNHSLLQDPSCIASIGSGYRQYVKSTEDSLSACSKNIKRKEAERREKERLEKERLEKERMEKENLKRAGLEKDRLAKEKLEKEKLEKEKSDKRRAERLEKERVAKLEKERAEIAERERLEKIEKERLAAAERERVESERIKKEEDRKRKRMRAQQKAEQECLDQERLETARLEEIKLDNERLEKEKLEADRAAKEKSDLEAKTRSDEQRRKRRAEKARLEEIKVREQIIKLLEKPEDTHSQVSRTASEAGTEASRTRKESTKQKERRRSHGSEVSEKPRPEPQEDKNKPAKDRKESRREQDNAHLNPGDLQAPNVGKKLHGKAPATTKSKSFEELPMLGQELEKASKKSNHSRSRSTSGRPDSSASTPIIPEIVIHQQPRSSSSVAGSDGKKRDRSKIDDTKEVEKSRSKDSELATNAGNKREKTERSAQGDKENVTEDKSTKVYRDDRFKDASPRPKESSRKERPRSASVSTNYSDSGSARKKKTPLAVEISPDLKTHDQRATKSDSNLLAGSGSNGNASSSSEPYVVQSTTKSKQEEIPVALTAEHDVHRPMDTLQNEMNVPLSSTLVESHPVSKPTYLSQGWVQSLSNYALRAAETLPLRRASEPERSTADTEIQSEQTAAAPPPAIKAARSHSSSVPGGWKCDFDEPRSEQVPVVEVKAPRNDSQTILPELDTGPQILDSIPVVSEGSADTRRRSRDFRRELFTYQEANKADEWFDDLEYHVHNLLDRYKFDSYKSRARGRVKIAILDTGVARSHKKVQALLKGPRIKPGKQFHESLPWNQDVDGHGTHAVGLIRRVCPYADIYVYRVVEGHESLDVKPLNRKYVTDALIDAVDEKKVDIISMSLGWNEDNDQELRDAIANAKSKDVLLFAATSNDGVRGRVAYPARASDVIAIDSADPYGNPSRFNPPNDKTKLRFTVLGEAVNSTYPMDLKSDEPGWKRMSGTSCATPIAAGIAGLILEFARQPPIGLDFDPTLPDPLDGSKEAHLKKALESSVEGHLKKVEGMRRIFKHRLSTETNEYYNLNPMELFQITEQDRDGGDWYGVMVPREIAALDILKSLRAEFSSMLGQRMVAAIIEERRGLREAI